MFPVTPAITDTERHARIASARFPNDARDVVPFARHAGTQRWHFHLDCSSYPAGSRVERQAMMPVDGVLCRECRRHLKRRRTSERPE